MAWVRFSALRGKGLLRKLLLPLNLLRRVLAGARARSSRAPPDVVLGMGGYVSFPGGMMAALLGRPLVLHEQNSVGGLANRCSRGRRPVLVGFRIRARARRREWTGNPVRATSPRCRRPRRASPGAAARCAARGRRQPGRAGAERSPCPALALMPPTCGRIVTHQAGAKHIEACARYAKPASRASRAFIDDMARRYAEADLVDLPRRRADRRRAGRGRRGRACWCLSACGGRPSDGNARFLADRGAAVLLPQRELTPERLLAL
jgi:UDP-N-acetylglucosamine--N-acetylmuramyl-(pentapeptide) pyrophosphoryl-undecaprenol N-acetylglucosamine transferase